MAIVDCGMPSYSLVRRTSEALRRAAPPWLRPGSVSEVLQSAKSAVLSFDFVLPRELRPATGAHAAQIQALLRELHAAPCTPEAAAAGAEVVEHISVDLTSNTRVPSVLGARGGTALGGGFEPPFPPAVSAGCS